MTSTNSWHRYTDVEDRTLTELWRADAPIGRIAAILGRSKAAVTQRAFNLGLHRNQTDQTLRLFYRLLRLWRSMPPELQTAFLKHLQASASPRPLSVVPQAANDDLDIAA